MAVKLSREKTRLLLNTCVFREQKRHLTRLAEVGRFEIPKQQGKYESGQPFLHRVFGYRGVVLFPWLARVYDRDVEKPGTTPSANEQNELKGKSSTYYQVLMDNRDSPFTVTYQIGKFEKCAGEISRTALLQIKTETRQKCTVKKSAAHNKLSRLGDPDNYFFKRAQAEAVTFLGSEKDSSLYAIPGLDYVSHEDVLPYIPSEQKPINHELFDRFFAPSQKKSTAFVAQDTLRLWHEKNHRWLELSDVHRETTEDIRVTAIPFYMGSRELQGIPNYWWRYCIRLENLGQAPAQLRERYWKIFSLSGTLETVRGRGVVGQEPKLTPQQSAFQYSSHVSLHAPSGHMWGTFRFEKQDGSMFDVKIPPFSLESKDDYTPPVQ